MEPPRIEELARRLAESLPEAARSMRQDVENNFRAVLHAGLEKLDLTTRTEFEVHARVLERARTRIEQLEGRIAALEQLLRERDAAPASPASPAAVRPAST